MTRTNRERITFLAKKKQKQKQKQKAPEVRLELTTYRLTAGRATDCAIQEHMLVL